MYMYIYTLSVHMYMYTYTYSMFVDHTFIIFLNKINVTAALMNFVLLFISNVMRLQKPTRDLEVSEIL